MYARVEVKDNYEKLALYLLQRLHKVQNKITSRKNIVRRQFSFGPVITVHAHQAAILSMHFARYSFVTDIFSSQHMLFGIYLLEI
jgi:hypothetical protein